MIEIRQEKPNEYFETENVIREAFWNHYTPACNDHYLIHIMRDCPAFVPELDLVALDGDKIVGSTMCLRACIVGDDGKRHEVLSLGPIGVLPEYQKKGIGGMLIARTKKIAQRLGFKGILLCGDPDYYTRQGFLAAEKYGIRNAENMYADALHGCELYSDAFAGMSGRYYEDDIYNVDEARAKEYDALFPSKEIVFDTPMQRRFEMMVGKVRPFMNLCEIEERTPQLIRQLLQVWEKSVRATHLFLSEDEIKSIGEYVPLALQSVSHLITANDENGRPAAFMGVDGEMLEMLFIAPEERRKGLGKRLLCYGIEKYGVKNLTVNEQNPRAKGFYEHMGFEVYMRTDHDEQGNPWPLLYMRLK